MTGSKMAASKVLLVLALAACMVVPNAAIIWVPWPPSTVFVDVNQRECGFLDAFGRLKYVRAEEISTVAAVRNRANTIFTCTGVVGSTGAQIPLLFSAFSQRTAGGQTCFVMTQDSNVGTTPVWNSVITQNGIWVVTCTINTASLAPGGIIQPGH